MKGRFSKILGMALPLVMILSLTVTMAPARTPTVEAATSALRFSTVTLPKIGAVGEFVMTPGLNVGEIAIDPSGSVMFAEANTQGESAHYQVTATVNGTIDLVVTYTDQDGNAGNVGSVNLTSESAVDATGSVTLATGDTGIIAVTAITTDITASGVNATGAVSIVTGGIGAKTSATWSDTSTMLRDSPGYVAGTAISTDPSLYKSTDGGNTWTLLTATQFTRPIVSIQVSPNYATDTTVFVATDQNVIKSMDGGTTWVTATITGYDYVSAGGDELITDMDVALDANGRLAVLIGTQETTGTGDVWANVPATTGGIYKAQLVGRDVLGVAFSPIFASDEGIFAVTINGIDTRVQSAFGYTDGVATGWGLSVGDGLLYDTVVGTGNITAQRARIAFPDDFDVDSLGSNVAFVGIQAPDRLGLPLTPAEPTGIEAGGDVYKVVFQPTLSSTLDLNVRGLTGTQQTGTNAYSIDVSGEAASATIMVGTDKWSGTVTPYYWLNYISNDSGSTWSSSAQSSATGGDPTRTSTLLSSGADAQANVLLSPDYATSGIAYTATAGLGTSALSRTVDEGKSFNQISFVDFGTPLLRTYRVAEQDTRTTDKFYLRLEEKSGANSSLYLTTNGGTRYERVYSYANPGMPADYDGLDIKGSKKDVFFIYKKTVNGGAGRFWRSTDSGASFPRTITAKDVITSKSVKNETSIFTLHANGGHWYTENLGRPWTKPDENNFGGVTLRGISRKGSLYLVRSAASTSGDMTIHVSQDAGKTYLSTLGTGQVPYGSLAFDPNFAENGYIYRYVTAGTVGGIYRITYNEENPEAGTWVTVSPNIAGGGFEASVMIISGGIMYGFDKTAVVTGDSAGGIWRSTNFSADIEGIYPPIFKLENNGLTAGDLVNYSSSKTLSNEKVWYMKNYTANAGGRDTTTYYNQLLSFSDTLKKPVSQVSPADEAFNAGVSLSTTDLTMTAVLSWEAKPGATNYQWQVARDSDFQSVVFTGYTAANEASVGGHVAGSTYYWRVRVAADATPTNATDYSPTGAPLISPWSDTRSYTSGSAVAEQFGAISPIVGAMDVSRQPTFTWSAFEGAIGYEVMLSESPEFTILDWSHSVDHTFYKPEGSLAYGTTYYWRVRGVTGPAPAKKAAPGGPWATGVFTTEAKPVEEVPAVVVQTEPAKAAEVRVIEVPMPTPAPAIPTGLLYTIVGIGAILIIALIILIVRTRRVA